MVKIVANPIEQRRGPVKIREALGKVQGAVGLGCWDITVKMVVPTAGSLLGSPSRGADAITA